MEIQSNKYGSTKYKYKIEFIQNTNISRKQVKQIEVVSELKEESLKEILFSFLKEFNSSKKSQEQKLTLINGMFKKIGCEDKKGGTSNTDMKTRISNISVYNSPYGKSELDAKIIGYETIYIQNNNKQESANNNSRNEEIQNNDEQELHNINQENKPIRSEKKLKLFLGTVENSKISQNNSSIKEIIKTMYFNLNYIIIKVLRFNYCAKNLTALTNDPIKWVVSSFTKYKFSKKIKQQEFNAEQENKINNKFNEFKDLFDQKLSKENLNNELEKLIEEVNTLLYDYYFSKNLYESLKDEEFKDLCIKFSECGSGIIDELELTKDIENGLFKGLKGLNQVKKDIDSISEMYNEIGFNEVKENFEKNNYEESIKVFNNCLEKLFEEVPVEYTEYNEKYKKVMAYKINH